MKSKKNNGKVNMLLHFLISFITSHVRLRTTLGIQKVLNKQSNKRHRGQQKKKGLNVFMRDFKTYDEETSSEKVIFGNLQ